MTGKVRKPVLRLATKTAGRKPKPATRKVRIEVREPGKGPGELGAKGFKLWQIEKRLDREEAS